MLCCPLTIFCNLGGKKGEEYHQIALQEQHKSFVTVRNHLRKAKKRQAKYADRGIKEIEYKVGDQVYYKIIEKENFV